MEFKAQPTWLFLEQVDCLSDDAKRQVEKKLNLVLKDPFRNKRIHGFPLTLFRIRLEDRRKSLRIIYTVERSAIRLLCITDRKQDYRDLREYLRRLHQRS